MTSIPPGVDPVLDLHRKSNELLKQKRPLPNETEIKAHVDSIQCYIRDHSYGFGEIEGVIGKTMDLLENCASQLSDSPTAQRYRKWSQILLEHRLSKEGQTISADGKIDRVREYILSQTGGKRGKATVFL